MKQTEHSGSEVKYLPPELCLYTVHGLSANLAAADLIPREGASTVRMVERWMRWSGWL